MSVLLHLLPLADSPVVDPLLVGPPVDGAPAGGAAVDSRAWQPPGGIARCVTGEAELLALANAGHGAAPGPYVVLEIDSARLAGRIGEGEVPTAGEVPTLIEVRGPIERAALLGQRHARRAPDGRFLEFEARPARAARLELLAHPEGGWYRRTWAAAARLATGDERAGRGERAAATAILYFLSAGARSRWHVVSSDELWCWHGPGMLELELAEPGRRLWLGPGSAADPGASPEAGCPTGPQAQASPQLLVPGGTWQRARAAGDTLASCVVSPGFDFADFRMADHQERR